MSEPTRSGWWTASQAPIRVSATSVYKWKAVEGAVKYQVVARRAPHRKVMAPVSPDWKVKKTTTDLRYTLTMGEGSTWTVGVRAINAEGAAGPVSVFPTTTRPLPTKRLVRAKAKIRWRCGEWRGRFDRLARGGAFYRGRLGRGDGRHRLRRALAGARLKMRGACFCRWSEADHAG